MPRSKKKAEDASPPRGRWRLECEEGRQTWVFDEGEEDPDRAANEAAFDARANPNAGDRTYRARMARERFEPLDESREDVRAFVGGIKEDLAREARGAAARGFNYFSALQDDDGHWPADYGGPMFLMPGLVIASRVTGVDLGEHRRREMVRYLRNHQNEDGGWGMHIEGKSTMFGTVLNYVALRLLGAPRGDPGAARGREWIQSHGGAVLTPSWGKFWLCLLGVFEWDGFNSVFPELWLMPRALPLHPSRYWCHCRMVYLPMAYVYGERLVGPQDDLTRELREELYCEPYEDIDWPRWRCEVCTVDRYWPTSALLKTVFWVANTYERFRIPYFRRKAMDFVADYVRAEDMQTDYIDIGPVNKVINMVVTHHRCGPDSEEFRRHRERLPDYLWVAEDGMRMQGYNGTQLWDTAFTSQAVVEAGMSGLFRDALRRAHSYIDVSQVREETPERERWFRQTAKGAWPFSTRHHGWPISDCTSEGLKAALSIEERSGTGVGRLGLERLSGAIDVILKLQNDCDGGWATYENTRGPRWLELINPSEIFGDIMTDISYVECTSASCQAMLRFAQYYPDHRAGEIRDAVRRGVRFIKRIQRDDGSWYGSWAICFTYGTWFGVEGLLAAGEPRDSEAVRRACGFLASKQRADGSWGESYRSSEQKEWHDSDEGQVVNTSWAVMTLCQARYHDLDAIRRGVRFIIERQQESGEWEQQRISGVFNGSAMITYTQYRNHFSIWALGRYANMIKELEEEGSL